MARVRRTRHGRSYLEWLGEEIQQRVEGASMRAIDRTTEATAAHARSNHKGWKSVTGTAESSIGTNPARKQKRRIRGNVTGGEGDAFHLLILEVKNGSALRSAADLHFPAVQTRLAEEYAKGGVGGG
jgi:hypothetical protein